MLPSSTEIIALPRSRAREAAASFVRGTTFGWGRRDLAEWLVCHYSPCLVADATQTSNTATRGPADATFPNTAAPLDGDQVERVILDARSSTLRLLSHLAWPSEAAALARTCIARGAVVDQPDANGDVAWAPAGLRRMRLADRVASLLIADWLNVPHDYRRVSFCRWCGELGFSRPVQHDSSCERALRVA